MKDSSPSWATSRAASASSASSAAVGRSTPIRAAVAAQLAHPDAARTQRRHRLGAPRGHELADQPHGLQGVRGAVPGDGLGRDG